MTRIAPSTSPTAQVRRKATSHARRRVPPAAPPRGTIRGRRVGVGDDRGASAAQLALVTPLFMLLLLLIVQVVLVERAHQVAASAARQATDAARARGAAPDAGQARAQLVLDQLGPAGLLHPTVTLDAGPDTVTVTVSGQAPSLIPGLHPTITARSAGVLERLRPTQDTP